MAALVLFAGCTGLVELPNGDSDGVPAARSTHADEDDALGELDNESATVLTDAGGSRACVRTTDFPAARDLSIRELALYQTVKIPLYRNGAWVQRRAAPVIANKKALLRVFVDTQEGYQPHDVRAVLKLVNDGVAQELLDDRTLAAGSEDDTLASTFNFQVDATELRSDASLSVTLIEKQCNAQGGSSADTRISTQPLEATPINPLEIVIVPVRVDGREPDTDAGQISKIRAALLAYYPVPNVQISVRKPLIWTKDLDALDGNSWSDLLNQIMRERRADAPASNVYYLGLVQPDDSFRSYCTRGCVLGLAPQTTSVSPASQVALGASFADAQTYETVVHELGHAHGRAHAPCVQAGKIEGVDANYPDKTGATISWGWDSRSNTLMPPTNKDIMGYCEPNWISLYNYASIAQRSQQVNLAKLRIGPALSWRNVVLYDDGRVRWGGDLLDEDPPGEPEAAQVLDASGQVIETIEITRLGLSHAGAQFLYVPEPGAQWSALQLRDRVVQLSSLLAQL